MFFTPFYTSYSYIINVFNGSANRGWHVQFWQTVPPAQSRRPVLYSRACGNDVTRRLLRLLSFVHLWRRVSFISIEPTPRAYQFITNSKHANTPEFYEALDSAHIFPRLNFQGWRENYLRFAELASECFWLLEKILWVMGHKTRNTHHEQKYEKSSIRTALLFVRHQI